MDDDYVHTLYVVCIERQQLPGAPCTHEVTAGAATAKQMRRLCHRGRTVGTCASTAPTEKPPAVRVRRLIATSHRTLGGGPSLRKEGNEMKTGTYRDSVPEGWEIRVHSHMNVLGRGLCLVPFHHISRWAPLGH